MHRTGPKESRDQGLVTVAEELCKGCALCVVACPVRVIEMASRLNAHGYHPAFYTGRGCTACGICFYACPEPGAISIYKKSRGAPEIAEEALAA